MTGRKRLERVAGPVGTAVAVLLCGGGKPALAATSFVPSVGADAAWTDNINLSPPGQEKAGEVYDLEPGFALIHDSAREQASVSYTLHALFFSGGSHELLHTGSLASVTQVLPDWLELDIAGQRTQGTANPAAPANLEYLFPVENIGNFTSGLVKPVLKHAWRSVALEASYTAGISQDDVAGGSSALSYRSRISDANFTLNSVDQNARLTWGAAYQREQDEYQSPYTLNFLYEQATANVGLLTISTLRLIAQGGAESDPQNGISQGGLNSAFWAVGFDWSTGPRDDLKLLVGHRFFGNSYEAHWRRASRLLRLQVDYTEEPTTLDAMLLQAPLAAPPVIQGPSTNQYSRLAPDVFLEKNLSATAAIQGRVTEIGLTISSQEQIYYAVAPGSVIVGPAILAPNTSDHYRTAMLYGTRHLGPVTDVTLSATLDKYDYAGSGSSGYTGQEYSIRLTRRTGRHSSVYLRGDHLRQYGGIATYDMNMVSIGANISFGNPPARSDGSSSNFGAPSNFGQSANHGP